VSFFKTQCVTFFFKCCVVDWLLRVFVPHNKVWWYEFRHCHVWVADQYCVQARAAPTQTLHRGDR